MSLDGFLTFFGLLITGYAVLDPISRLKLRIDAPLQIALITVALLIILPFEFVLPILGWLPERYAIWFVGLEFGQPSDLLSNSHIAFLATFFWALTASLCLYFSRPRSGKLKRLLPLVERLHDEGRYLELLELVEPYLEVLKQSALKNTRAAKIYSKIEYASGKRVTTDKSLNAEEWKSHAWCRWFFIALAWGCRSYQKQFDTARLITDILAKSEGVRDTLQTVKPKFAADFFVGCYDTHYDWCDLYLAESMKNKDSHLRQDIKRTDGTSLNRYYISEESVLLAALVGDAHVASKLGPWKPVGDAATKVIKEDKSYQARLHEAPPQDGIDLFDDITYSAIHFFDILVRQAATQEYKDHMSLRYLYFFIQDLEVLPANTTIGSDPISNGKDMKEKLIFNALNTLENWVEFDRTLPNGNAHKAPENKQDAEEAVAIPVFAAVALYDAVRLVVLSEKFSDDFKVSCLRSFVLTGARGVDLGSYLRKVLAEGLFEGLSPIRGQQLRDEVNGFKSRLDITHLFEFSDLGDLLT